MIPSSHVLFYDTTLRDGAQTKGVDFSLTDKITFCHKLDELGIDFIEAGWPGANPIDTEFFKHIPRLSHSKIVAFGMPPKNPNDIEHDPLFQTLVNSHTDIVCIVGKTHDYQVKLALGIELEDNINALKIACDYLTHHQKTVFFDAEHFFDGYKANPDYSVRCLETVHKYGINTIVLCDTNGGSLPEEIFQITRNIVERFPDITIGIHCHNDAELAVANTLSALQAGARHLQGTINGLGERCGNTNLCSVIPTIMLKKQFSENYVTSLNHHQLMNLTQASRHLDECLNRLPTQNLAYVGTNAFAHKGGLHVSAVLKDPSTYEHINPEWVGNKRVIPVSNQSGKSNIIMRLKEFNLDFEPTPDQITEILEQVKHAETQGYGYDSASASFYLKALKICGRMPNFFDVDSFRATSDGNTAEAIVKLTIHNQRIMNVSEGYGPVDALYQALVKDLGIYHEIISDIELEDYKVRIIGRGTAAKTRVLIDFKDNKNNRWSTVGVSDDIVTASFDALRDSVMYYLSQFKE